MNLKDIIGGIGDVASFIHPAIGGAIKAVNSFLPDGADPLPADATPEMIHEKIKGMPPEVQAQVMLAEIDVELAEIDSETRRVIALAESDKQTTRPFIAKLMAFCVCYIIVLYSGIIIYGIAQKVDMSSWWPLFGVILAVPAEVLRNYFGNLRKEQANRMKIPEKSLLATILNR